MAATLGSLVWLEVKGFKVCPAVTRMWSLAAMAGWGEGGTAHLCMR